MNINGNRKNTSIQREIPNKMWKTKVAIDIDSPITSDKYEKNEKTPWDMIKKRTVDWSVIMYSEFGK